MNSTTATINDLRKLCLFNIEEGVKEVARTVLGLRKPHLYAKLDLLLDELLLEDFSHRALITFLTTAGVAKDHLNKWSSFAARVREHFTKLHGEDWAREQLRGLIY